MLQVLSYFWWALESGMDVCGSEQAGFCKACLRGRGLVTRSSLVSIELVAKYV